MITSSSRAQIRAQQVSRRRVAGYLLLSAVLPGSVQLYTGGKRVGRWAIRIWFALLGSILVLALGLAFLRGPTLSLLLNSTFLIMAKITIWIFALGWVALLVDSWRRCEPLRHPARRRLGMTVTAGFLIVAMLAGSVVATKYLTALSDIGTIFSGTGDPAAQDGRINILLLGGDSGPGRQGMRPDSIMVASIDQQTGRTVLFGLPRNLERAPFPERNPLHSKYPKGYVCEKNSCMLNGIYTLAHDNVDLFPGIEDPGMESMQDVVSTILGIKINYYALIDLSGFQSLVDAVGGIRIDVGRRIPVGDGDTYIEPGKNQLLDGYHSLWFARSRKEADDYDRMARQRCVLSAMLKQLDPTTVATRFADLAAAGKGVARTSVPHSEIAELVELALKAKGQQLSSVSFSPPLVSPPNPDFDKIREEVQVAISRSKGNGSSAPASPSPTVASAGGSTAEGTGVPSPATRPTAVGSSPNAAAQPTPSAASGSAVGSTNKESGESQDVSKVCAVS